MGIWPGYYDFCAMCGITYLQLRLAVSACLCMFVFLYHAQTYASIVCYSSSTVDFFRSCHFMCDWREYIYQNQKHMWPMCSMLTNHGIVSTIFGKTFITRYLTMLNRNQLRLYLAIQHWAIARNDMRPWSRDIWENAWGCNSHQRYLSTMTI